MNRAGNNITAFTRLFYVCLSFQKLTSFKTKKFKLFLNETVICLSSSTRYETPWTSELLISGLKVANHRRFPDEVQTFHHWIFLWGFILNVVYLEKMRDLLYIRGAIKASEEAVTPNMLERTWQKTEYRLDFCRTTKVRHMETFWHRHEDFMVW